MTATPVDFMRIAAGTTERFRIVDAEFSTSNAVASALIGLVTAGCRVRLGTSESSSAGRRYGSRSKDGLDPERRIARLCLGRRVRIRVCKGGVPLVDQILEASRVPVRERSGSHISRRSWVVDDGCRVGWRRVGRRLVRIRFGFGLGLQVLGAHVGRVVGIVGNGTDLVGANSNLGCYVYDRHLYSPLQAHPI